MFVLFFAGTASSRTLNITSTAKMRPQKLTPKRKYELNTPYTASRYDLTMSGLKLQSAGSTPQKGAPPPRPFKSTPSCFDSTTM